MNTMKKSYRRYSIPNEALQSSFHLPRLNQVIIIKNEMNQRNKKINKTRTILLLLIHSEHVEQLKTTVCKINTKTLSENEQVYASEFCIQLKTESYSPWNSYSRGGGEMYNNRHKEKSLLHFNSSDDDDDDNNHFQTKITRRRIGWQKLTKFTKFLRQKEYQQFLCSNDITNNTDDFDNRSFHSVDLFCPLINNLIKVSVCYLRRLAKTMKPPIVKPRKSVSYSKRNMLNSSFSPVKSSHRGSMKKTHGNHIKNNKTKNDYIKILDSPEIVREEDEDSYYKKQQGKSNKQLHENDDDNKNNNEVFSFIRHVKTGK